MTKPYTVALKNASALTVSERISAECRFAAELERLYSGRVERLVADMREFIEVYEWEAVDLTVVPVLPCGPWKAAVLEAETVGLLGIQTTPEQYVFFEVRPYPDDLLDAPGSRSH